VVVIGLAMRAGHPISFWEFTRKGVVMTAITIVVAAPYLWLRYFVLS
jgi:Na+/H+ antiporter NhaD/arsenite permease-like protein